VPTTRDLFFWLPKLLDFVEQPLEWVLFLLIVSLLLFWRRRDGAGRRTLVAATLLLAFLGFVAVPELIVQRLENMHPPTSRPLTDFEGVVVLGGGLESGLAPVERGQSLLGSSAERVTTAVSLARRAPHLRIVLTGYAGTGAPDGRSEAEGTALFFAEQGLAATHLMVEPGSRNTSENADNAKRLPGVDPLKPWLLLTSAWTMPRALGAFRKAGWNVEPMPVDYVTGTSMRYARYSIARGASRWNVVLHEVLGLAWYRMTGRM
jgi:uncharacterized SAM-binding protein YcdF (DUF218 family)